MAKVQVKDDCIDIRVSMVERLVLSERSRRVPLSRVRSVDPHPAVVDMVLHWADQSGVWLSGASTYEGHLVPSSRNPGKTMAIDLGDDDGRVLRDECIAGQVFDAANHCVKIVVIFKNLFLQGMYFGFEIRIFSGNLIYFKTFFSLYDDGGTSIRHFDQFGDFCYCADFFQVAYSGFFYGTVFLRYYAYQFVSLVCIANGFNALISPDGDW